MPRGGGKGGTLLRARSFKLRQERDRFFFYRKFLESRKNWRRAKSVTLQRLLLAETGRTQSGRSGELLCFFAVLPAVPGATGLPVLALLLALLSQCPRALPSCFASCELSSICKQSGSEWSGTKCSGMSEQSVCYLFIFFCDHFLGSAERKQSATAWRSSLLERSYTESSTKHYPKDYTKNWWYWVTLIII